MKSKGRPKKYDVHEQVKIDASKRPDLSGKVKFQINNTLAVYVSPDADKEAVRQKYIDHINNYQNGSRCLPS